MNIKVLVANTSSKVRENITRSLKEIGVQNVMEAGDANTAINLLKQEQFNAVLADGKIQTESGKGIVEEIRHIDSNVPIILTANLADCSTEFELKRSSAYRYLTKPFTTKNLRDKLQQLVPAIAG